MVTRRMIRRVALAACLASPVLALGGCAAGNYPTLPGLGGLGQKTLTPAEQDAKIKQLAADKAAADGTATTQPAVLTQPAPAQ